MRALLLIAVAGLVAPGLARSERYLSISEAQKVCFPLAARFEEKNLRYTTAEAAAIEKRSAVKAPKGNRMWIAHGTNGLEGVLVFDQVFGKHELIDYVVALSPEGKVKQIEVLEYRESHGGEIRGGKWRAQFQGKNEQSALRLNRDIYNISGATMSCRHVTEGVKRVVASFHEVRDRVVGGAVERLPHKP